MGRFLIAQQSYIDDRLYEKGQIGNFDRRHKPGPHWQPLDDEAREMMEASGETFTGEVPDVLNALLPLYEDASKTAASQGKSIDVDALREAFKSAMGELLNPEQKKAEFDAAVKAQVTAVLQEIKKANAAKKAGASADEGDASDKK